MATTPLGFAAKMRIASAGVGLVESTSTWQAGQAVAAAIRAVAPSRLRGVGKAGANLDVEVSRPVKAGSATSTLVRARGPWQLIERSTRPHEIIPRRASFIGDVGPNGRPFALKFGGRFAAGVNHPGTAGKRPFALGVAAARPAVPKIYQSNLETMLRAAI